MNIAILTDRYFPTPVSGAVLMHDLALELVSQRHSVLVLTGDSQIKSNFEIRKEDSIFLRFWRGKRKGKERKKRNRMGKGTEEGNGKR